MASDWLTTVPEAGSVWAWRHPLDSGPRHRQHNHEGRRSRHRRDRLARTPSGARGHGRRAQVRALSRRDHVGYTGVHWSQGDMVTGSGVDAAVDGVEVIVHCATQGIGNKDVVARRESARRGAPGRRRAHHLRVDRRDRCHPAAVLQDQTARRGDAGRIRAWATPCCARRSFTT